MEREGTEISKGVFGAFAFLVASTPSAGAGTAWYVDWSVPESGDGSSWETAFRTIQEGIDRAGYGDTVTVAPGLYFGAGNSGLDIGGKAIRVASRDGAEATTIACGSSYDGVADLGRSMLEGFTIRGAKRGIFCDGCDAAVVGCEITDCENAIACWNGSVRVANCSITGCPVCSAAVHCASSGSLTLTGCTICGGETGVYVGEDSQATISDCIFSGGGHGVHCYMRGQAVIERTTISDNTEEGILCGAGGSIELADCIISDNGSAGVQCAGGSTLVAAGCTICRNGLRGISCNSGNFSIRGCMIRDNGWPYRGLDTAGGGLCLNSGATGDVRDSILAGNCAGRGGGVYCSLTNSQIVNCVIVENDAQNGGGACCADDGGAAFINCTISGNLADFGSALYCSDGSPGFVNSVLQGGGQWDIYCEGLSSPSVTYCAVREAWPGEGNIVSDPLFLDERRGDYRLCPASPCIDAGDNNAVGLPEADARGMHRIMYGGKALEVDIGAYEFHIWPPALDRATGDITLKWSSLAGKTYSAYYCTDMTTWQLLADDVASMGDTVTTWIDPTAPWLSPDVRMRHYRIAENE